MGFKLYDAELLHSPESAGYWAGQSQIEGTSRHEVTAAEDLHSNVVQIVFSRTVLTGYQEDAAVVSLACTKALLGVGCDKLDSSEMAAVETALNTWWGSVRALISSHWTLSAYRWHHYTAASTKPGPAVRATLVGTAATGSATDTLPDQVATSVTFKTAFPKHWGRQYLPPLVDSAYTTLGKLDSVQVDLIAGYYETLLEAIDTVDVGGTGVTPVVRSPQHGGLMSIDHIQVDDTPDVIRSRRAKQTTYRKVVSS